MSSLTWQRADGPAPDPGAGDFLAELVDTPAVAGGLVALHGFVVVLAVTLGSEGAGCDPAVLARRAVVLRLAGGQPGWRKQTTGPSGSVRPLNDGSTITVRPA